jgi:hypothetical protein
MATNEPKDTTPAKTAASSAKKATHDAAAIRKTTSVSGAKIKASPKKAVAAKPLTAKGKTAPKKATTKKASQPVVLQTQSQDTYQRFPRVWPD